LKERILHAGHVPFNDFWALRDVEFEVHTGETFGIIGRNGSGKSTLLKCIAGILQPTSGQIVVRGQVAAMLELGAGFQPELSGRDNIFLNASLLGLSRREIERRFDAIVAFAELEEFIDNQVRFYSSSLTCCSSTRCSPSGTNDSSRSAWNACTSSKTRAGRSSSCRIQLTSCAKSATVSSCSRAARS
jgi:ABC-type polysaccharide/polyol phosphate transport system ATPase subunit